MKLIIIVLCSGHLVASAFFFSDGLINVPLAKQFKASEIQFNLGMAYNGSPSIQDISQRYDIDIHGQYSMSNTTQIGLSQVNSSTIVGHIQHVVSDFMSPNQLSIGLRNIHGDSFSSFEDNEFKQNINMSPYIVNTFYTPKTVFSIGYGLRVFQHDARTLTGILSFMENLNGVFFGVGYRLHPFLLIAEYDGRDVNFGVRYSGDDIDINVALTEQFISGDYNPQHGNAPRRQASFGISFRNLFSPNKHFNDKIKALNQQLNAYELRELTRIESERKNQGIPIISEDEALAIRVIELYSTAFEAHELGRTHEAIHCLHEALILDPTNDLIASRLGSLYHAYGFPSKAIIYWSKAIQLNPNAPYVADIKALITTIQRQDSI